MLIWKDVSWHAQQYNAVCKVTLGNEGTSGGAVYQVLKNMKVIIPALRIKAHDISALWRTHLVDNIKMISYHVASQIIDEWEICTGVIAGLIVNTETLQHLIVVRYFGGNMCGIGIRDYRYQLSLKYGGMLDFTDLW